MSVQIVGTEVSRGSRISTTGCGRHFYSKVSSAYFRHNNYYVLRIASLFCVYQAY